MMKVFWRLYYDDDSDESVFRSVILADRRFAISQARRRWGKQWRKHLFKVTLRRKGR